MALAGKQVGNPIGGALKLFAPASPAEKIIVNPLQFLYLRSEFIKLNKKKRQTCWQELEIEYWNVQHIHHLKSNWQKILS